MPFNHRFIFLMHAKVERNFLFFFSEGKMAKLALVPSHLLREYSQFFFHQKPLLLTRFK
jgi:hypothetical protein